MTESPLRFGAYILQDAPFPDLAARWQEAEALGFDQIWLADHTRDWRDPGGYWFDGWTALAALAGHTQRARIGPLVSNPLLRPPAVLARLATTVDHLSGGRLELGIGTGIAGFDHDAVGIPYWSMGERIGRFGEYVDIVDQLLSRAPDSVAFDGNYLRSTGLAIVPPSVQRPRPPLTIAGQSPTVLSIAAARADCWNTHGPFGRSEADILQVTRKQNSRLDHMCEQHGRDPRTLRRSLLLIDPLDAWATPDAFERIVGSFLKIGMREFVVCWPRDDQRDAFERAVTTTIPAFRNS